MVSTVDGEPSLTESIAECPADSGGRISGCMCNMDTYPERGCQQFFVRDNQCVASSDGTNAVIA